MLKKPRRQIRFRIDWDHCIGDEKGLHPIPNGFCVAIILAAIVFLVIEFFRVLGVIPISAMNKDALPWFIIFLGIFAFGILCSIVWRHEPPDPALKQLQKPGTNRSGKLAYGNKIYRLGQDGELVEIESVRQPRKSKANWGG